MFQSLLPLFGTKTKAQEIILLLHDAKPVVRQGFYPAEIPKIQQFCRKNNIFMVISKFKVLLADDRKAEEINIDNPNSSSTSSTSASSTPLSTPPYSDYSNKGQRIPEHDPRLGMYFVYLAREEKKVLLAAYYEQIGNDLDLGRILGYPECCVHHFMHNFSAEKSDLQHPPTNPYTNLSKREQDYVLLSHFPCRSDCKESILLAKKYLGVLERIDSQRAQEILQSLTV